MSADRSARNVFKKAFSGLAANFVYGNFIVSQVVWVRETSSVINASFVVKMHPYCVNRTVNNGCCLSIRKDVQHETPSCTGANMIEPYI